HALDQAADHHVTKTGQRFAGRAAHFRDAVHVAVNVLFTQVLFDGKDDQVRSVRHLALSPRGGEKLLPRGWVSDDDELPGLKAEGRGAQDQRFFQRGPILRADLALRVKLFGGVAPVELADELVTSDGVHNL